MIARRRRFAFTAWWRTVDKLMLAALLVVMLAGIVLSLAASPPVAARLGLDPFYWRGGSAIRHHPGRECRA